MPALAQARGSEFAELSQIVKQAGLLRRRYGYYAVRCGLTLGAFALVWVGFAFVGDSWWQLGVAVALALVSTHLAFTGHDAGHKQIFRGRAANDAVGLVHAGLVGLSYGWWVGQHNRHHANPNHETDDPDLDISVLAFTVGQAHEKRGFLIWMAKYQAYLFFPLLLLEGISLRVSSFQSVWRDQMRARRLEKVLMIVHVALYLTAVFLVLSPLTGLVFILVHNAVWGVYMGCSFAPNHKGMPTVTDGMQLDFLRKQVLTSRNIRGGFWVDFLLGGLNYQIEHHLFPNMPRPSLRAAQPIVEEFCAQRGVSYSQCGVFTSYRQVLSHLHEVGAPLRAATG
ncbi:acyl-CoA desaturase [Pseudonocardiaceae bacterium YIM PH 21723]|nr:acyl-CoA desaturase [Pseudonocardiaceae bacterium YIM PH 21723]